MIPGTGFNERDVFGFGSPLASFATEPSFLCSYISSLFPWSAVRQRIPPAFSIAALRLFLCQQLFKSSLFLQTP